MTSAKPLQEILALNYPDMINELYDYVVVKRSAAQPLQAIEEEVYLVLSLLMDIEMEGFVDLFFQFYSWRECAVVESALRKLDLHHLADLFNEAKQIYTNGKEDITEKEYQAIEPFGDDQRWQRFDAIGDQILAEGSEIYLIGERMYAYVKAHRDLLVNQ